MIDEPCVGRAIAINCVNSKLSQESKTEESMLFIEKGYFFSKISIADFLQIHLKL